jgi:FKBP-type peptidyl-prolyl cis-trans isomerase 2
MDKPAKTDKKMEQKSTGPGRKTYLIVAAIAVVIVAAVAVAAFVVFGQQVAANGEDVSVYYTGMFGNGTVVESNVNGTPFEFTLGNASDIPAGFQDAIVGMTLNQSKTVTIPVAIVRTVNRTGPIANFTFVEGQLYEIHRKTDNTISVVKILNVTPTTVTWDENGLLAGQNLTFTIRLVGITKNS